MSVDYLVDSVQAIDDFSTADYAFYDQKVQEFMQHIKDSPDEDMAKFAAEMFSKQNIHRRAELQNYLRHRFKGEKFRGAKGQRALMRELNARLCCHSLLILRLSSVLVKVLLRS